jgi:hypothetical protein
MTQIILASDVKISTKGKESVVIEVQNNSKNEKIKIFDKNGNLLFFENINKDHYLKTFTMNNLPNGEYHVIYENESKINLAIVLKNEDGMLITSDFSKISFKPMINQKGDYLSIGYTNPKFNNVEIKIIDDFGNELVEINDLNDLLIKKTFNTKNLPGGHYIIKLRSGDETFTNTIEIK